MKNTIKLSLVAAVAVAGLTTNATAGSLEDAIKDTTISGKILVGYNYAETKSAAGVKANTNQTEYDIDLTLNTKVNDTITATVGFQADNEINENSSTDAGTKGNNITLTKLSFTAKTDVATVIVGKQKQPTPFYDDERGDGVVALVPAGPVTIAAGHFTGLVGGDLTESNRDISALAVIGSVGPVNASVWYAQLSGASMGTTEDGASAYTVNLAGTFGPVNVDLTHSAAEVDDENGGTTFEKETLTKLIVSAKVADVNLVAGYGMTNDVDGDDRNHGVDLSNDDDAKTNFRLDQLVLDDHNDADAILLGASMTFGQTTIGANYLMVGIDATTTAAKKDATELDLTVAYAMSKNFSITGLYSTSSIDDNTVGTQDVEEDRMELSLNYKF